MLRRPWLAVAPLPVAAAVCDMGKRGHKHSARQRSGLINFRRYNEIGAAVCFFLDWGCLSYHREDDINACCALRHL